MGICKISMKKKIKIAAAIVILLFTIAAQMFISVKYFIEHDPLIGFIALISTVIWSVAAWQIHLHVRGFNRKI
jgi:protein-S-isoprenylcysteine O-methyltransferase Ste14